MEIKKRFTKRACRYTGAVIAAGVTTFIGLMGFARAEAQTCSLQEAISWQLALSDSEIEQTPTHILTVTEAFLAACPDRPEFADASRIAGIASVDLDQASRAVTHFRAALPMRDTFANFYAIAAFASASEAPSAWALRDDMISLWHKRLERHPDVSVSIEPTEFGPIYQIYFSNPDEKTGLSAAWVAVPSGPGWPATLTFSKDPVRLGLRKIRAARDEVDFRYIDLHRCRGRRSLGRISTQLTVTEFDAAATASLTAYLANPDIPGSSPDGQIETCVLPGRLLPDAP